MGIFMIVLVKRNNILLIGLVFLLLAAIYSLNFTAGGDVAATNIGKDAQKTIVLDAGHGGEDPGMVSEYGGVAEEHINLSVALKAKELLEKEGFKVIMTRTEDRLEYALGTTNIIQKRKQDLLRRKEIMDQPEVSAVVSIHMNSFPEDTKVHGAQTFYPHNSPESQKLAVAIQEAIRQHVDPENTRQAMVRGKPQELPIIILRDLKNTTVILEGGFLSNQEETAKLATDEYQQKLAVAVAEGVKSYFAGK